MREDGAQLQLNAILAREGYSDGLLVLDIAVGVVAEEELGLQEREASFSVNLMAVQEELAHRWAFVGTHKACQAVLAKAVQQGAGVPALQSAAAQACFLLCLPDTRQGTAESGLDAMLHIATACTQ